MKVNIQKRYHNKRVQVSNFKNSGNGYPIHSMSHQQNRFGFIIGVEDWYRLKVLKLLQILRKRPYRKDPDIGYWQK